MPRFFTKFSILFTASSEFQPLSKCTASGRSPSLTASRARNELSTPPLNPMTQSYSPRRANLTRAIVADPNRRSAGLRERSARDIAFVLLAPVTDAERVELDSRIRRVHHATLAHLDQCWLNGCCGRSLGLFERSR